MPSGSQAGDEHPSTPQRLLVVTGLSGSGKTTTLQALEDLGWETIDNFPVRLLGRLAEPDAQEHGPLAIGIDSRTRGLGSTGTDRLFARLRARSDIAFEILFLDCASVELERRYNETRRRHPLAQGKPVSEGIRAERELLARLREQADRLIDTTNHSPPELQEAIRNAFAGSGDEPLTLTITSFGFARGMPPLADLVFDVRFLDNPHWRKELRPLTGLDPKVAAYIEADDALEPSLAAITNTLDTLLPLYQKQNRTYLTIAFGCTGGRHRSVYTAERVAKHLRGHGFSPNIVHRQLANTNANTTIQEHERPLL